MSDESVASMLASNELFEGLPEDVLEVLARHAEERRLERNAILFGHGDPAREFFLLRSGAVVIEVPAISGPSLEVQHLGPGEVLGWSWLIPPYRWSFQARAEEPTELLAFDGEAVRARCEADAAFGYAVLRRFSSLMSERLEAARLTMMEEWNPPGFA